MHVSFNRNRSHTNQKIYTIDANLKQISELNLTKLEATQILIALRNVISPNLSNLSPKARLTYHLMMLLKYDHRSYISSLLSSVPSKRFSVGIAYLKLVASHKPGIIEGRGSTLNGETRYYQMIHPHNKIPDHQFPCFNWEVMNGFDQFERRNTNPKIKNGNVTYYYTDGSIYEGNWLNGKRNGYGTYYCSNGDIYIGQWKNDEIEGSGIYYYANGNVYKGNFKNGCRHGAGVLASEHSGYHYHGNWDNNLQDGQGKLYHYKKLVYAGNYSQGKVHGKGTYYFKNLLIYKGEFQHGVIEGKGALKNAIGQIFEGQWKNNQRQFGIQTFLDSRKFRAYWKNDRVVGAVQFLDEYDNPLQPRFLNAGEQFLSQHDRNLIQLFKLTVDPALDPI